MRVANLILISFQYFALVFSAGFLLGTLRVLVLVDAIGARYAELAEMPLMVLICGMMASYLVKKYGDLLSPNKAIWIGVLALVMLLVIEFTAVLAMRGLSLSEYFASRDLISGGAYIIGLIWFAIAPLVIYKSRAKSGSKLEVNSP